ncbi:NAD binding Rossmann fold oxidoreductase [Dacryopinax primogenitus]|uniref:NAD binding Rossmann fold oxidoreductase n=1 Tax=Dacryopinax primogenitus (strain DJM 731) TaxID=1858805 RepID=M5G3I3_DACPD|nr:NAD binding Rossmann fold oxidoreductase [Dacryopinax primogenitus]EJU03234.1 NAD binding Rossmann fold oxidoreductase [Dacryopinax primogenitus]
MPDKILNVCVYGIGNSANTFHIPYILSLPELYKLYAIYERDATPQQSKGREKFGHLGVKIFTTLEEVLADPAIDLCVIATKSPSHYELAKATLSAGKSVILEKPITVTWQEVHDLATTAKAKGVTFVPFHNRRFDGDFLTVRKLLAEGKLNLQDIVDFESRYDVRADWGAGSPGGNGGSTYGLGCHLLDQTVALFGKPKTVTAILQNGRRVGDPAFDDAFTIHLRYDAFPGLVVTCRSALHSVASHQVRYIIREKNRSFVKYGLDSQEPQVHDEGMKPLDKGFGEDPEELFGEYGTWVDGKSTFEKIPTVPGSYRSYYRNVGETILGKAKQEVTGEQGEIGMRIIQLSHKSHKEGRTVAYDEEV